MSNQKQHLDTLLGWAMGFASFENHPAIKLHHLLYGALKFDVCRLRVLGKINGTKAPFEPDCLPRPTLQHLSAVDSPVKKESPKRFRI